MSVVPFRPRALALPASVESTPHQQFSGFRQHMMKALQAWLATRPPDRDVDDEVAGTVSMMTQLVQLDRMEKGTGT